MKSKNFMFLIMKFALIGQSVSHKIADKHKFFSFWTNSFVFPTFLIHNFPWRRLQLPNSPSRILDHYIKWKRYELIIFENESGNDTAELLRRYRKILLSDLIFETGRRIFAGWFISYNGSMDQLSIENRPSMMECWYHKSLDSVSKTHYENTIEIIRHPHSVLLRLKQAVR